MAIGIYFSPKSPMSAQAYNECIKRLKKSGSGNPVGRVYHACFGSAESLSVFDVWTSQAAFDKFARTLVPIMQDLGVVAAPVVMPIHNVIVPPAKKSPVKKAAAKRPAPSKPAAKKNKARPAGKKR